MRSKDKREELDRLRIIILQTLEYMIEHYTGSFVLDDYDPSKEYYLQEKKQVEKYYKERRLERMRAKLANFTQDLYLKRDTIYQYHIEEKTGHRIDLYENLRVRTNKIIQNGIINNKEEFTDIEFMIFVCRNESNSLFDEKILQNILDKYQETNGGQMKVPKLYNHNQILSDDIKIEEGLIYKVNSPNSKNWIALYTSGKNEFALTYLVAGVDGGSGSVYCAKGEGENIKAEWENDFTIIIETDKKYEILSCYRKITTKNSNIRINYIDNQI